MILASIIVKCLVGTAKQYYNKFRILFLGLPKIQRVAFIVKCLVGTAKQYYNKFRILFLGLPKIQRVALIWNIAYP
jgi:hypothetical protein